MTAEEIRGINHLGVTVPDLEEATRFLREGLGAKVAYDGLTGQDEPRQGEEVEPARAKAQALGVKEIYIDDLREEFVRDFVYPMFRANTVYEGEYLLGTSIARPLIAKRLIEIANETGADAISHGATGKGNDQVRFELSAYALDPSIKVIAPWRLWDLTSRTKLIEFAEQNQIPIAKDKRGEAPFSVDANLLHTSSEGKALENPAEAAPDYVYQRTVAPEDAPDWAQDRAALWNAAEARETRANSVTAREWELALPAELDAAGGDRPGPALPD